MTRIVMKFGGTSTADTAALRLCATHIAREVKAGLEVAVVVSAPAGMTNELTERINEVDPAQQHLDEVDLILSSGEQINAGLLVLLLRQIGISARSWTGWQAGFITDNNHGNARLEQAQSKTLCDALAMGEVAVLTGFQGITEQGRITTLGRGGSDVSAVALAAALHADRCDIYTDVTGVFTADPAIVPTAQPIARLAPEEMLELASNGAKVLHSRSLELALAKKLPLRVLSTFIATDGTLVAEGLETHLISGVTYSRDESRINLSGIQSGTKSIGAIFSTLAEHNINVDMIVHGPARKTGLSNLVFATSGQDHRAAIELLQSKPLAELYQNLQAKPKMTKVSVIGLGLRSQSGMADSFFAALSSADITIDAVATSELRISALIAERHTEHAVRALHFAYGLDKR